MENASKALLIVAGMLIVGIILMLIIYGWRSISDYYKYGQTLQNIEDVAKFNKQFENYDRDDLYGTENGIPAAQQRSRTAGGIRRPDRRHLLFGPAERLRGYH